MNDFRYRMKQGLVLFDGAMGTQIQALTLPTEAWEGKLGCNELLNLTARDSIRQIHEDYLSAGADVIETNTFGANAIVLSEYGLQDQVEAINCAAAQIAREAIARCSDSKPRFVAGSIGPGTKLISLGQTDFAAMHQSYFRQMLGLLEGGVDLIIIETCQDLLQIKTSLAAVRDAMARNGVELPVIVSVTVETSGTLLIGSEIGAVAATLAPFELDALGLNCATGPEQMRPFIKQISRSFKGAVICQPNAGLPRTIDGRMVYPLPIEEYVETLSSFITEDGVSVVGGCCGTTPDYIRAMAARLPGLQPAVRAPASQPAIASLFSPQLLHQEPGPFFVGERTNTNGSKQFRNYLLKDDWNGIAAMARQQQNGGAHGLDLCVAYTGRDESADMRQAVSSLATQLTIPLFIDSTDPRVVEQALQLYGGRAVINSINLEDGEGRADAICRLAKRYGAALIALTIDETGMAHAAARKLAVAQRIYELAVHRHGLNPSDLIFDALTFTLGSGDESLRDAGINTLEGLRAIKRSLSGVFTLLGVSNISFGLNPAARETLNSVFLAEAIAAGLDLAIVNVEKIRPLYRIDPEDVAICLDLIYNRGDQPLLQLISHFDSKAGIKTETAADESRWPLAARVRRHVIQGNRMGLEELLKQLLLHREAIAIINETLVPAMKTVGDLFGAGKLQLPFVLQSAEVMKFAVDTLKPHLDKTAAITPVSLVLATVRGDVHDIGKNLVDIILTNNGYKVYNLGIKCEIGAMLDKAAAVNANALGMSGLLVKSALVMKENLEEMQRRGIHLPVLLGGAALTRSFVEETCAPVIESPVVYCADAFEGLKVMELLKENKLEQFIAEHRRQAAPSTAKAEPARIESNPEPVRRDIAIPVPPFWGAKTVRDIDLDEVFPYLTETVLFRGRWGYRRGKLSAEAFRSLIEEQAKPELARLKLRCKEEKLFAPAVIYGYFPCRSEGEAVIIYDPDSKAELLRFRFPRQRKPPFRCIADFFLPAESAAFDVIAMQVVTIGPTATAESQRLYAANAYKDYLLFHGLSVETAEALAEYWHRTVRQELNIAGEDGATMDEFVVQRYRGSRYSFGYPACPDMRENGKLLALLHSDEIGITLTDEDEMIPEQTTSALIVHHPQAKYFTIE